MIPRGRRRGAAAAVALLALAAPAAVPAAAPTAYAQAAGTIAVDLVESVGADWFAEIGDREVVLRHIEGIDPTTAAGQEQLGQLDIPALVRGGTEFPEIARAATSGGKAQFTGIAQGVYLVEATDNPETRDARVSYSPAVVVVVSGSLSRTVAPKAQVLGVAVNSQTACNSPSWFDAAAPGTYLEYTYAFNAPNPSTDGTISTFEVFIEFSRGHTVQWHSDPVVVRAAQDAGAEAPSFETAGDTHTVAVRAPWWQALLPGTRETTTVVKLTRPMLTLIRAGETAELNQETDYTVDVVGNERATFTLTPAGREALTKARLTDPSTRLEVRIPAEANAAGPWGTVSRGEVLGTLESTARLRTDGMDALRTPVDVSSTSHVNVVSRKACFTADDGGSGDGGNGGPGGSGGSTGAPGGSGVPGSAGRSGSSGAEAPDGSGQPGSGQGGQKSGQRAGLASTGAGVIGITAIAVLLIALGLVLRRRDRKEEASSL
ncbi:hypothetical protein CAPI_08255 [Corynebacterium capitovis DSM 44611]|uniref:hypothetical protein n=1 Tax=Corynebacterium capitovis TaxID=131081 RepID=UPI0003784312|nr:hypothetical protein [Corynebacterium capitovis]WKD58178.1 hypothetical protein CAPI_08255 [Corynebacterium capitovis DSM 44611]